MLGHKIGTLHVYKSAIVLARSRRCGEIAPISLVYVHVGHPVATLQEVVLQIVSIQLKVRVPDFQKWKKAHLGSARDTKSLVFA